MMMLDSIEVPKREKYEICDEKKETRIFGLGSKGFKGIIKNEKYFIKI